MAQIAQTTAQTAAQTAQADAFAAASKELVVEVATTPEQILEAKRLRYTVYCEERNFLPGENGIEEDEFDSHSRHILVRSRATGEVFGTVRVVLSKADGTVSFPMQNVCEPHVLRSVPFAGTAEISRFAVKRDRTGISPAASALMRLYLIQGIVQVSGELGLTHWCATMERTLIRLLRSTGIYFQALGEPIEYHGLRQPAVWPLSSGFAQMHNEQPHIWNFLTNNGTLWSEELPEAEFRQAA